MTDLKETTMDAEWTTDKLTAVLEQQLHAASFNRTLDWRVRPASVARHYGVPLRMAQLACRRLARRGVLKGGRTVLEHVNYPAGNR
jgi:hypothetical protein